MDKLEEFFEDDETIRRLARRGMKPKRRKTPKKNLEAGVIRECMQWLDAQGCYCERRNTGAFKTATSFIRFGNPGAADLLAVIHGRHVEIECKRRDGKGRLSDNQKTFRATMKECGIPYVVVTSVEQLAAWVGSMKLQQTR